MNTRRHRALAAALAFTFVASACSGGSDDTTAADGTTTSAPGTTAPSSTTGETTTTEATTTTASTEAETTTSTTAAETTTTEEQLEYVLALAPDGLTVVEASTGSTNLLPFGSAQNIVINAVTDLLGSPSQVGEGSPECGNGQDFVATWDDDIMLEFAESSFIAWSIRPGSSLTNMAGIGWGTSLATLQDTLAISIEETSLGTEFATGNDASGYGGLLTDGSDAAVIDGLWAGPICTFR